MTIFMGIFTVCDYLVNEELFVESKLEHRSIYGPLLFRFMLFHHYKNKWIMTLETDIIQPVKDFVRDSKFLLNRCTKPDRKGERLLNFVICRIHSDCDCLCCWFRRYGTCRLFCQADSHSYQQHSYWCLSNRGWWNLCQLVLWQNSLYNWSFILNFVTHTICRAALGCFYASERNHISPCPMSIWSIFACCRCFCI